MLDSSLRRRLLGAIWLCFVARGLYCGIDAYRSGGEPPAPGWIFCSLAAGGACLLVKGLRSLAFKAAAVPLFPIRGPLFIGSHVVLTPYYAGLIAYSPTGRLAAFPLDIGPTSCSIAWR